MRYYGVDSANASQVFGRPSIPPLSSTAHVQFLGPGVLVVAKHNGVREGGMKKIMSLEVGWKSQSEGNEIDVLNYTEGSQLLVIKFRTWMGSRDVSM